MTAQSVKHYKSQNTSSGTVQLQERLDLPSEWTAILLMGTTGGKSRFTLEAEQERWRVLFGEALWSIWTHRCAWSFGEVQGFTEWEMNGTAIPF